MMITWTIGLSALHLSTICREIRTCRLRGFYESEIRNCPKFASNDEEVLLLSNYQTERA